MIRVHHDAGHTQLLVDTAHHDLLVHALVVSTDEVAVEVDVEVVERLATRQRHIGVDVVHVERVRRHRHAAVSQDVHAVAQRVHEQVLRHAEVPDLIPGQHLVATQHVTVVDDLVRAILHVLVHVVGDHEVNAQILVDEPTQRVEELAQRLAVEPVVGVDHLEVGALRVLERLEHRHAVAAVLLVHGLHDVGVARLPGKRLGQRVILGRAVVDDDHLHVVGMAAALDNRRDAVVHVGSRVIAGDAKGYGLAHVAHALSLLG